MRYAPMVCTAVSGKSRFSFELAAGNSLHQWKSSALPIAKMWPVNELHAKTSPVLRNRCLQMLEAARFRVLLVKEIVEARGKVEIFVQLLGEERGVHEQKSAQICSGDRSSLACILSFQAAKESEPRHRKTQISLRELFR